MENKFVKLISEHLQLRELQVLHTVELLESGCTIPFISRYRKEATGALDEVQVAAISEQLTKLQELEARKQTILKSIESQEKLTPELQAQIADTWNATELEDLYLPYKPKRRTRAEIARQKGLEPLANMIQANRPLDVEYKARAFVKDDVKDVDEAIQGALDIIAERVNEDSRSRNRLRRLFSREAIITSKVVKGKEEEGAKFQDYFDFSERFSRCASHRMLALRRGEAEGTLRLSISVDEEKALQDLERLFTRGYEQDEYICMAVKDGYKRLLAPSIETEFFAQTKEAADAEAIRIFARNLEQLLMAAPLGQKRVLGIDPGFRTGCKVVCLSAEGDLLHNETIYPHPPVSKRQEAASKICLLVKQYKIEAISIGNGTASRETEAFVRGLGLRNVDIFVVSEDGASIYSASKTARDEFPDKDVTVRGAVSIGRRLMDPLSELVKIDASSIGVGQYQKDVDQKELKHSLDRTVESCVNRVGVNVNTASKHLLAYISGLGPQLAQNIVDYRSENGPFSTRKQLMKVPRMGAKAFEQAAGFLRISGGKEPLDNSAVHPESYGIVEQMAKDLHCTVADLLAQKELRKQINIQKYVTEKTGIPTLQDIMNELDKPGRDPRGAMEAFSFREGVHALEDLQTGMVLPGIVTNITLKSASKLQKDSLKPKSP
ncbi:MAG: Tex family protein, partial [Bacteroidales bacterium]|nr:Tex family protein [Bacteroidales bacterium]